MCSLSCNSNLDHSNCLIATMPIPPAEAAGTIRKIQEIITPIFERTYKNVNPLGTAPIKIPELTSQERYNLEMLRRELEATPGWKEYTEKCRRWAILA